MSSCGPYISSGIQMAIDANMRYLRMSHKVYLRLRNFTAPVQPSSIFQQLGFPQTPVSGPTGTFDLEISPQPAVRTLSQHDIGMSMGQLLFGARQFGISGSFSCLLAQALSLPYTQDDLEQFWFNDKIVGLVTDRLLFDIKQVDHEEVGGVTVMWTLLANANQVR